MTVSPTETLAAVRAWFDDRFARLADLGGVLIAPLGFDETGLLDLSAAARRTMKSAAARYLAEQPVVDGCGLIFAHSALGTEDGRLEWWVREDETRFARYSFGVVPGGDRYYDYEQHEWFIEAFNEGRSTAVGPYIDYLGVEGYLLTLTAPAEVAGRRVGAVGNDIRIEDLETALLPILLDCADDCALLGTHGNVLVCNTSRFLPGEYLAELPAGYEEHRIGSGARGMRLIFRPTAET